MYFIVKYYIAWETMFQGKSICHDCPIQQSYQELLKRVEDLERLNKEQATKISELESEIKKYVFV